MFDKSDCIRLFDTIISIEKFGKNTEKCNHFFLNANRNKDSAYLFDFKRIVNDIITDKLADKNLTNGVDDFDKITVMQALLEQLYLYYLIDVHYRANNSDNFSISDDVVRYCNEKCAKLDFRFFRMYRAKHNFIIDNIDSVEELDSLFESIINLEFEKLKVLIYYNEMLSDDEYRQQRLESIDRMWNDLLGFCKTKEEIDYIVNKALKISTV